MYTVYYYMNKQPHRYTFVFETLWGAIFKARCLFEEHGFPTDVMRDGTGEIVAIFEPGNNWIAENDDIDATILAKTEIK